eukprot:GHVL01038156.1.p1 GENE.GHVL01038156.1~~GHVL01038156.1.p1  ORF type:complete len:116 (+),score=15.22 GHVL01038156.1:76-423(+)
MKLLSLTLLVSLTVVGGELLQVLHMLHQSHVFQYLDADEQVRLTEIVAAAEACKLTALAADLGKDMITSLIVHLPGQAETAATKYIMDHIKSEETGTCVVEVTAPPPQTTRKHGH